MADPDFKLCDVCGERTAPQTRLSVVVGVTPDPADGKSQYDYEAIDLCPKHMAGALLLTVNGGGRFPDEDAGKRLFDLVKQMRETHRADDRA